MNQNLDQKIKEYIKEFKYHFEIDDYKLFQKEFKELETIRQNKRNETAFMFNMRNMQYCPVLHYEFVDFDILLKKAYNARNNYFDFKQMYDNLHDVDKKNKAIEYKKIHDNYRSISVYIIFNYF